MRKAWRIDKRGKKATVTATNVAMSDASSLSPSDCSDEERKRRALSFLTQNMAAAIAEAVLANDRADGA